MNTDSVPYQIVGRRERAACLVAGLTCSAGIFGAMLLGFQASSTETWLLPTPALTASLDRCDRQGGRAAVVECKQQAAERHRAAEPQVAQLAQP